MLSNESQLLLQDLAEMPLFQNVTAESVEAILACCRIEELGNDDVLMCQGDSNQNLYLVLSGELSIHLDSLNNDPIAYLGKGETVGEMSLIDKQGASAYVKAASECKLLVLTEKGLWSLVTNSHPAACNLLGILTSRLRNANIVLSERMRLEYDFKNYGTLDVLSGLHNRYWLNHALTRLVDRYSRIEKPLSMIMTDIDLFKDFNTAFGHLCGDRVIHTAARVLTEHLRPSEMAARYGGDEFVVLLPDVDLEQARKVAERIRVLMEKTTVNLPDGSSVPAPTLSIGIAQYRPGDCSDDFIALADAAMYRAKALGRDCVSD